MSVEQKILTNKQIETNYKISYVSIGFMTFYYFLILFSSTFVALRFIPQLDSLSEFVEIMYVVVHYTLYGLLIIGLILLIIAFSRLLNNVEDESKIKLKRMRNLLILPLIIKPLTFFYIALTAFSAWGDELMGQILWIGGELFNHIILLIPFLYLAFVLRKENKNSNLPNKTKFLAPIIILGILILWIIIYPISLGLFLGSSYLDPLQNIMVVLNSSLQLIISGLGIWMFVEFGKKLRDYFTIKINRKG